ncbi:MAG: DUF4398 domain-containing protein [candidate division NC10 bacterium]|nr:DUF4398 domain-containing protein [candidate division NC10 bacterium]
MGLYRVKVFHWMVLLLLLMANVGCVAAKEGLLGVWDPVQFAAAAIKEAEASVEAAKAAGAGEVPSARYELASAEAYLSLARDEFGHPDWSGTQRYAKVAKEKAERALALAKGR